MMKPIDEDPRFNLLLEAIAQMARGDFRFDLEPGDANDPLDGLIVGLKMLSEELQYSVEGRAQAIKAGQLKERFLARISHEFRTPLNAIVGSIDLVLDEPLSDEQKKLLGVMTFNSNKLRHLVDDILDFSKMEEGKLTFKKEGVELLAFFEKLSHGFATDCQKRQISFLFEHDLVATDLVETDFFRLWQVFANLLSNATKFTSSGHIKLLVSVDRSKKDRIMLTVKVEDSGCGISDEYHDLVFDPYHQGGNESEHLYQGAGLVLSIVKQLLDNMGGAIKLESVVAVGTTFTVEVEFERLQAKPTKTTPSEIDQAILSATILIVEDNEVNQALLKAQLTKHNLKCDTANNGKEALECIQNNSYDVVFMDCQMPVMDGYKATQAIRQLTTLTKQPWIIACTANYLAGDREKCLQAGMDDFIGKPISKNDLIAVLNRYGLGRT